MSTIKQINNTLDQSNSLKLVAQAYSEIAAVKLQKIRKGIEKDRLFFSELANVYRQVRLAAIRQKVPLVNKNKGTISILISSNEHFYGDLESRLLQFYIINTTKHRTDRLVIGKTALEFLLGMNYFHPYQKVTLKKDLPSLAELQALSKILSQYQQIVVYHSRFHSVLMQVPQITDITEISSQSQNTPATIHIDYIFEPEVTEMLQFFDNQITLLLLEQTFLESELARTGARLISMEEAQDNADKFINEQRKLLASAQKSLFNNQLLEMVNCLINSNINIYNK